MFEKLYERMKKELYADGRCKDCPMKIKISNNGVLHVDAMGIAGCCRARKQIAAAKRVFECGDQVEVKLIMNKPTPPEERILKEGEQPEKFKMSKIGKSYFDPTNHKYFWYLCALVAAAYTLARYYFG